ncbi:MAG: N-(5'-phosphoribosyl)anthranilate isomerase [Verrucomicrobiales bacterium]
MESRARIGNPERVRIKICGLRNFHDAQAAWEAGADVLGFNGYVQSSRYLDLNQAKSWLQDVPPWIGRWAVLVNPTEEVCHQLWESGCFEALQLHGDESPAFCDRLKDAGIRVVKALRPRSVEEFQMIGQQWGPDVLVDASVPGVYGGSGHTADWNAVKNLVAAQPKLRVILAGGLTSENVGEAIDLVRPFAVDVAGGVESEPGCKDAAKMHAFVAAVRHNAR